MAKTEYPHNPDLDWVVTKFIRDNQEDGKFTRARLELHSVRMPAYSEKDWYIQGTSMNAFRHRMQKRHVRAMKLPNGNWSAQAFAVSFWFRCELRIDYEERRKIEERFNIDEPVTIVEHASLWDFYKAIGYDYKKNKLAVEPTRL